MFNTLKKGLKKVTGAIKKGSEQVKAFGLALIGFALANGVDASASTFSGVSVSTTEAAEMAVIVAIALGTLWGLKAGISFIRKG